MRGECFEFFIGLEKRFLLLFQRSFGVFSLDFSAKTSLMNERAELVFTFTDVFNDFALQHDIIGNGFSALYQNFMETQVATLALKFRF
jgi:hypothetical protein